MHVSGKIFGKICLKATRDTFYPICRLLLGKGKMEGLDFFSGLGTKMEGTSNRPEFPFLENPEHYA